MFVKIIETSVTTGCETLYESLYDCFSVKTSKVKRKDSRSGKVVTDLLLEMEGRPGGYTAVQIEQKAHCAYNIFTMNNAGKTIDSYSWDNKQR